VVEAATAVVGVDEDDIELDEDDVGLDEDDEEAGAGAPVSASVPHATRKSSTPTTTMWVLTTTE